MDEPYYWYIAQGELGYRGLQENGEIIVNDSCILPVNGNQYQEVPACYDSWDDYEQAYTRYSDLHIADVTVMASAWDNDIHIASSSGLTTLNAHTNGVTCMIRLLNDQFASCSADHRVRIWKLDGSFIECIGHTDEVWTLFQHSNESILSFSLDGTVRVWDVQGKCLKVIPMVLLSSYRHVKVEELPNTIVMIIMGRFVEMIDMDTFELDTFAHTTQASVVYTPNDSMEWQTLIYESCMLPKELCRLIMEF